MQFFDPEVPQSGFGVNYFYLGLADLKKLAGEVLSEFFQRISLRIFWPCFGDLKIFTTSTSTERQKRSQNLAPVLVIISGNSLVLSRKMITSIGFYRGCVPGASALVVKNQSPIVSSGVQAPPPKKFTPKGKGHATFRLGIICNSDY